MAELVKGHSCTILQAMFITVQTWMDLGARVLFQGSLAGVLYQGCLGRMPYQGCLAGVLYQGCLAGVLYQGCSQLCHVFLHELSNYHSFHKNNHKFYKHKASFQYAYWCDLQVSFWQRNLFGKMGIGIFCLPLMCVPFVYEESSCIFEPIFHKLNMALPHYDCPLLWWELWNCIVRQLKFIRFLHTNEHPQRTSWYLVKLFD